MLLDTSQRGGSIISGFGGSIILDLGGQLAWIIQEIVKLNIGQLSCKGEREFKIVGQSFSGSARWEQYDDGTIIEYLFGYECEDLIIYSNEITM